MTKPLLKLQRKFCSNLHWKLVTLRYNMNFDNKISANLPSCKENNKTSPIVIHVLLFEFAMSFQNYGSGSSLPPTICAAKTKSRSDGECSNWYRPRVAEIFTVARRGLHDQLTAHARHNRVGNTRPECRHATIIIYVFQWVFMVFWGMHLPMHALISVVFSLLNGHYS